LARHTVWGHTHRERLGLAATLHTLTPEQWEHDSLCEGWTVKDVAAHVISTHPQLGFTGTMGVFMRNLGRGYNTMIFRETKRTSARKSTDEIVQDFETYATSRTKIFTTTTVEPLIDALVHHQDIAQELPSGNRGNLAYRLAQMRLGRMLAPELGLEVPVEVVDRNERLE
jgi:uncharacterized protein (TIGR03083 family)